MNNNPTYAFLHPVEAWTYRKHLAFIKRFGLTIIQEARKRQVTLSASSNKFLSILDLILSIGGSNPEEALSDAQILDELMTFFLAGHETTASTVSFLIRELGRKENAEKRRRMTEEIRGVIGLKPISELDTEDFNKMTYTSLCIKETLRLYPVGPGSIRITTEDETIGGYRVPKDTRIFVSFFNIQRNPKYWPNPTQFIPERFETESDRSAFLYLPFSSGPRICVGQQFAQIEIKVVLSAFVNEFDWELAEETPGDFSASVTLRPKPFTIRLQSVQ